MNRVVVDRKIGWAALHARGVDLLMFAALVVVGLSYGLGYHLDWSEENGRPEDDSEIAGVPAPAMSEPASLARITPAPVAAAPAPSGEASMVAAPVASIQSDARSAAWDKMTSDLDNLSARYPGRVSIFLRDLSTGRTWSHNPDDLYPAASLIKVPILIAAFYKMKDGQLSLDEKLAITRRNRVGGSGSLKWRPDGTKLKVRDLLLHMINESDNTATRMILERVGLGYVQQQFPRMGLLYTGIYEEGMSLKGGRVAHENYTTAREMTMLLEKIYKGEAVDKASSEYMMGILKHPKAVQSRLAKGLPAGWEIAHKTGLLRQACHDSAVFLTPNGDYAMTVLTGQNQSYSQAKTLITKLAHVTFANYAGPRYYAQAKRRRRR